MARNEEDRSALLKEEIETELGAERQEQRAKKRRWTWGGIVLIIALLASIAVNAWSLSRPRFGPFPTDMKDARKSIEYETVVYTGAIVFDPKKMGLVRLREPGAIEYFGPPSAAVDKAWNDLLHGQFPAMTDAEAQQFLPNPNFTKLPETGRYHFDPDVFHSLHCINAIRGMLAGPLYGKKMDHMAGASTSDMQAHMDHCMDRIRQAVMCHGDLTPSPLFTYDERAGPIGRAGPHTCRKWAPIRAWMDERGREGPLFGESGR